MTLIQKIEDDNQWISKTFKADLAEITRTSPLHFSGESDFNQLRTHYRSIFSKFIRQYRESLKNKPRDLPKYLESLHELSGRIKERLEEAAAEAKKKSSGIKTDLTVPDVITNEIKSTSEKLKTADLKQTIDLDHVVAEEDANKKLGQDERFTKVKASLLDEFDALKGDVSEKVLKKALAVHSLFITFKPNTSELTALKKALSGAKETLKQSHLSEEAKKTYAAIIKDQVQKIDAHLSGSTHVSTQGTFAPNRATTPPSPSARPGSPTHRK
jgi:hypothetical protein